MTENIQKSEISILQLLAGIVSSNNNSIDIPISSIEKNYADKSIGISINQESQMVTLFLQDQPTQTINNEEDILEISEEQ
ncbi:hypothetical protein UFOVP1491_121 [uncultured Caudovirales phage]|uniref:Uncharacterized protein n=1 Tax=uncultured Caudovirales phage TaxID=2100421 RepID=A0A6J5PZ95_9CAUD|nr:hypothetical protein UFOVP485_152 [uncultured Caudovirales phage]CAB4151022.1 hypothetical protein UFOVP575_104 [uncultured Caudovirales phage]CAB4174505.1 hypothetical protein UFOVP963_56 [uncultured Caudovirales phage]CAB4179832.1 hypothetical protein UFOVP1032_121 [uncultured Caudovirales phage]CAB4185428.1 hypothetical protein UFOVP1125_37 [uncultured Caudovirales phage]